MAHIRSVNTAPFITWDFALLIMLMCLKALAFVLSQMNSWAEVLFFVFFMFSCHNGTVCRFANTYWYKEFNGFPGSSLEINKILLENIRQVDSVQHLSSSSLFPVGWSTEIKNSFSYFIGEQATLNQSRSQKRHQQNEKKTIKMFHFGQMGEESSQEVWSVRPIDDLLLTGGRQKGSGLQGGKGGVACWGRKRSRHEGGGLWHLSWRESRRRRAKVSPRACSPPPPDQVSQLLLGYTGPP